MKFINTKIAALWIILTLVVWYGFFDYEEVYTKIPTPILQTKIKAPDELFFTAKVSDNCTQTWHEEDHISYQWGKGYNVIANDVACGFQSEVYAPDFLNDSKLYIASVKYNELSWDYVELKWREGEDDMKWIIWHIDTKLTDWELVVTGQRIWQTNLSWMSTGHHAHIELHLLGKSQDYNISYMQLYHNEMEKRKPIVKWQEPVIDFVAVENNLRWMLDKRGKWELYDSFQRVEQDTGVKKEVLACITRIETQIGERLKSKNNYGNIGNNDRGDTRGYETAYGGIYAIGKTLSEWTYLSWNKTLHDLSSDWGTINTKRYATDPNWINNLQSCLYSIYDTPIDTKKFVFKNNTLLTYK